MDKISFAMNTIAGYDYSINFGKLAPDFGYHGEEQAMTGLRTYSEATATGRDDGRTWAID